METGSISKSSFLGFVREHLHIFRSGDETRRNQLRRMPRCSIGGCHEPLCSTGPCFAAIGGPRGKTKAKGERGGSTRVLQREELTLGQ